MHVRDLTITPHPPQSLMLTLFCTKKSCVCMWYSRVLQTIHHT